MSESLQARLQGLKAKLKQSESKRGGQTALSRTESESSDVKVSHNIEQHDGMGRSVGQTALASGFSNGTAAAEPHVSNWGHTPAEPAAQQHTGSWNQTPVEPYSSSKVESPLHRGPIHDAQRDLMRQLQDANADLQRQLQEARASAADRASQVQRELDSTRQKLQVMKEQLMTGQADAEETGRQILEQATQELHARHALELQRVNAKMEEQNTTILMLEQKLTQQQAESKAASHNRAETDALREQLASLQEGQASAREACHRLQAECAEKAQQVANLEVAIGELTFAAERGQKLELSTCQAQEEAKKANEAAHHAQGAAFAAQQDLANERKRAQELQVRCFQAEEQCAKMVIEMQSLHAQADSLETELAQWQQQSLAPANRQSIIELIGKLFTSESDGPEDLQAMAEALRMTEQESQTLMEQGQQLRKSRGLLHGIRALPRRLLGRPNGSSGTPRAGEGGGLGSHWVQFLTEEEPSAGKQDASSAAVGSTAAEDDMTELPVSVPSA